MISILLQFFDMSKHDAVKALNVYKRAGQQVAEQRRFCVVYFQLIREVWDSILVRVLLIESSLSFLGCLQAENLADFYEYCKGLELARNFQFPTLRQVTTSYPEKS